MHINKTAVPFKASLQFFYRDLISILFFYSCANIYDLISAFSFSNFVLSPLTFEDIPIIANDLNSNFLSM